MNIAAEARAAALSFETKKDGLTQLQDGSWVLKLKVHPSDIPSALLTAAMGTRFVAALVEVADDETPVTKEEQTARTKPEKTKRRWDELPLSQQAAMRCGEIGFQTFLSETRNAGTPSSESATNWVREHCRVHSRKDIKDGTTAGTIWRSLDRSYQAWLHNA